MNNVQILGTGCRKCAHLQAATEEAIKHLGLTANVEKIQDIAKIAEFGVFMTPALVIDGEVKTQGRVPSMEEIEQMFSQRNESKESEKA
ncbi:MAG: thioredoxin family protein [Pirellulales bacterium]